MSSKRTTNNSTVVNLEDQSKVINDAISACSLPPSNSASISIEKSKPSKAKKIGKKPSASAGSASAATTLAPSRRHVGQSGPSGSNVTNAAGSPAVVVAGDTVGIMAEPGNVLGDRVISGSRPDPGQETHRLRGWAEVWLRRLQARNVASPVPAFWT